MQALAEGLGLGRKLAWKQAHAQVPFLALGRKLGQELAWVQARAQGLGHYIRAV